MTGVDAALLGAARVVPLAAIAPPLGRSVAARAVVAAALIAAVWPALACGNLPQAGRKLPAPLPAGAAASQPAGLALALDAGAHLAGAAVALAAPALAALVLTDLIAALASRAQPALGHAFAHAPLRQIAAVGALALGAAAAASL